MNKRLRVSVLACCIPVFGILAGRLPAGEVEDAALAERVAALADRLDNSAPSAVVKNWLYEGASRLSEKEVRFRRQRYIAAMQSGDNESALAAVTEWRKLDGENLYVQKRLIDAHLERLGTTDTRLNYLKTIVDAESLNAEVRSHAAMHAGRLLMEQSRSQQAFEMLRKSVQLFPLNIGAMELQWQLLAPSATPLQRVNHLLSIVRADPASTQAVVQVATDLASANMVQESLQWYGQASTMARPTGGLGTEDAKDYAAELIIAGQDRLAGELAARLLERNDTDPGAWFLAQMATRNTKDRVDPIRKSVLIGLVNRLSLVRGPLGVKEATTRPMGSDDTSLPDVSGDAELLKGAAPRVQQAYVAAVSDLVWMLLHDEGRTKDAAPLLARIKAMEPENSPLVTRLEGWSLLKEGKLDEARSRLSAIADTDPLAALGVIQIQRQIPAEQGAAAEAARRLIKAYPARTIGAIIRVDVGELAGQIAPDTMVEAIRDSLDRFPKEVLRASVAPQEFVALRITPVQVGHEYAEPIIAELEVRNLQDLPLLVGPNGIVNNVWIDAETRGLVDQMVRGATYEPVDGPVRLAPNGTLRWKARLDRGPLADVLERNVTQTMQMRISGLTNAVPSDTGIVPGACGVRGRMNQMVERRTGTLTTDAAMRRAHEIVEGTDQALQLRLVDQIAAHYRLMADPDAGKLLRAMEPELRDMLLKLAQSNGPAVRCWARFQMMRAAVEPAEQVSVDLSKDEAWYGRALSAVAAMSTTGETRSKLLKTLDGDADATVRKLALALEVLPEAPKPATIPAR